MSDYIDILDIIEKSRNWLKNPEGEKEINELEEIKRSLQIRPFLLLKQKELVINQTLYDINIRDLSAASFSVALEISSKFNALFAYTNISEVDTILKEPEIYDILQEAGIFEEILKYCKEDYLNTIQLINNSINFERIKELLEGIQGMDKESIENFTDEIHRFKIDLDPKIITTLGDIMKNDDPLLQSVSKVIENNAYNSINNKKNKE